VDDPFASHMAMQRSRSATPSGSPRLTLAAPMVPRAADSTSRLPRLLAMARPSRATRRASALRSATSRCIMPWLMTTALLWDGGASVTRASARSRWVDRSRPWA
jgi:hypothetical protein